MRPRKILVVDDDPIALEVARERLEAAGYEAHTRLEALGTSRWVLQNAPDAVLLDVEMPALSGQEIAQLLRRSQSSVRVILYSGRSSADLAAAAAAVGADGAVSKSATPAVFLAEIARVVGLARAS